MPQDLNPRTEAVITRLWRDLYRRWRRRKRSNIVSKSVREGSSTEVILARLRSDGAGKIDSIRALRDGARMPIADGKRIVHFSAVWADTKERDEKLWDVIEEAIKGLP